MENIEKYKREDARKLIKWIKDNRKEWIGICLAISDIDAVSGRDLKKIIKDLQEKGFYQIIILLLFNRNDVIQMGIENSILAIFIEKWNDKLLDNYIELLLDNIEEKGDYN